MQEGWLDPGTFHFATLRHLRAGKRVYYRFGSRRTGFSEEFSFLAPPLPGPDQEVQMIMLADMGQAQPDGANEVEKQEQPSLNTTRLMAADVATGGYSLLGHWGDISYADGYMAQWDR